MIWYLYSKQQKNSLQLPKPNIKNTRKIVNKLIAVASGKKVKAATSVDVRLFSVYLNNGPPKK